MSHERFLFGPACSEERHVFGSQRPGYPSTAVSRSAVEDWLFFTKEKGIKRICCLLQGWELLKYYEANLMEIYRKEFGDLNVLTVPVEDFHLADVSALRDEIVPFLVESEAKGLPVLVHCSGGSGRTGHVLAAWVVYRYGLSVEEALDAVNRNPWEAVRSGKATKEDLCCLLNACRRSQNK